MALYENKGQLKHFLTIGFPLSFGIFQNYMSTNPPFRDSPSISIIGTLSSGLAYLGTPFSMRIISGYPRLRTPMMWIGLAMCALSCLAASFSTKVRPSLEPAILSLGRRTHT